MSRRTGMHAGEAATDVLAGLSRVIAALIDRQAAAAMVGVDEATFSAWLEGGDEAAIRRGVALGTLAIHVQELAEYAWGGTWSSGEADLDDALTEAVVVLPLLGTGASELVDAWGNGIFPRSSAETLETVISAATARRSLDAAQLGAITVTTLAALAGVSEKTIRMAANPKNERPLRTSKNGAFTFIEPLAAREWLEQRADFRPTRYHATRRSPLTIASLKTLADHCIEWRKSQGMDIAAMTTELGWSGVQGDAYEAVESNTPPSNVQELKPHDWMKYAEFMGLAEPAEFAKQAYLAVSSAHANLLVASQLGGARR